MRLIKDRSELDHLLSIIAVEYSVSVFARSCPKGVETLAKSSRSLPLVISAIVLYDALPSSSSLVTPSLLL